MRHIQYIVSLFCLCLCIFSAQAQRLAGYEKDDRCYFEVIFELDSTFKDVRYVNPLDSAIARREMLGVQKISVTSYMLSIGANETLRILNAELKTLTSAGLSDDLRIENPYHISPIEKNI